NDSLPVSFRFRALSPVEEGKQRVEARARPEGDAVEKVVGVHRDAREVAEGQGAVLSGSVRRSVIVPSEALPGSARLTLTVYPDLLAQLRDSLEAILQRPHGCAEQTISSSYPSLLVLRALEAGRQSKELERLAKTFLEAGIARLAGFQTNAG